MWFCKKKKAELENLIKIESDIRETAQKVFLPIIPNGGEINYDRAIEVILLSLNDRITALENAHPYDQEYMY